MTKVVCTIVKCEYNKDWVCQKKELKLERHYHLPDCYSGWKRVEEKEQNVGA